MPQFELRLASRFSPALSRACGTRLLRLTARSVPLCSLPIFLTSSKPLAEFRLTLPLRQTRKEKSDATNGEDILMFRIGEFAQIAQVSTRQLRFYDQIGLLRPGHTDPQTGYRYYAIHQLSRLNAILALKDLGLMLDQIGSLLDEAISSEELRGMLLLKRAEAERAIRIEEQRLRHIESRIAQIGKAASRVSMSSPNLCRLSRSSPPATPSPTSRRPARWSLPRRPPAAPLYVRPNEAT
jgi:DNA-binding transcriptional MerR regulator